MLNVYKRGSETQQRSENNQHRKRHVFVKSNYVRVYRQKRKQHTKTPVSVLQRRVYDSTSKTLLYKKQSLNISIYKILYIQNLFIKGNMRKTSSTISYTCCSVPTFDLSPLISHVFCHVGWVFFYINIRASTGNPSSVSLFGQDRPRPRPRIPSDFCVNGFTSTTCVSTHRYLGTLFESVPCIFRVRTKPLSLG